MLASALYSASSRNMDPRFGTQHLPSLLRQSQLACAERAGGGKLVHAHTRCSSRPGACRPRGLTRLAKACSMLNTDGRCASNIACATGAAPGRGFLALRPAGSDYLPAQPGGGERVVAASDALPETKPGSGQRARRRGVRGQAADLRQPFDERKDCFGLALGVRCGCVSAKNRQRRVIAVAHRAPFCSTNGRRHVRRRV